MSKTIDDSTIDLVASHARELTGRENELDPVMELIGDAPFLLLGEASHGTHEFYATRAAITRRLIEEKGFTAVAVEADWPDAYRVNRFVRGQGEDEWPVEALGDFKRFPRWMWRNTDVVEFVEWLHEHNGDREPEERVGFYGLDLYSLHASIDAVIRYLERVDPDAAERARRRYGCFDHRLDENAQKYGYAVSLGLKEPCEDEAVEQLTELRREAGRYLSRDGMLGADEQFFAERNAQVVTNAERYYRAMFGGRVNTWNLRDEHMAETLAALAEHLGNEGRPAKIAVWEHNSHVGDAGATEMSDRGETNIGQLARRKWGEDAVLIGFTTHAGTVSAASDWDGPVHRKNVRPSLPESYERIFHESGVDRFFLNLREPEVAKALRGPRLERAIGVIYRPETERWSHYFNTHLPRQFDGVLHFDRTSAVEPLEPTPQWQRGEDVPETFPSGL